MAFKTRKVLIAIDYFPTAQTVAEAGFSIAKDMRAEITLLHILSDPSFYSSIEYSPITGFSGFMDMGQLSPASADDLKLASQQFLDKVKTHLGDNTIQTMIKEGDMAETIVQTARNLHADLIVMGSHSRNWLENLVMGSATEKVLSVSPIPLLIIPLKKTN